MAEVKWIKIVTDIFDDEKILLIESLPEADSIIVIWFKLLCLAGKQNNGGIFMMNNTMPYTEEMLSVIFRRKSAIVMLALKTFEQFGMIEIINSTITIPNWEKHQNEVKLEEIREYNRLAKQKERQRKQILLTDGKCQRHVNDSQDTDIEVDIDIDKEIKDICEDKPHTHKFIPPTIEEIKAYCTERNNEVDPEKFFNFYESKNWMVGKNKMSKWKAAISTWEKSEPKLQPKSPAPANKGNFEQRKYSDSEIDGLYKL